VGGFSAHVSQGRWSRYVAFCVIMEHARYTTVPVQFTTSGKVSDSSSNFVKARILEPVDGVHFTGRTKI
jgi:hypothetical protein